MSKIKVGIVGYGYWGPNLVRNFSTCPLTEVAAVCDAKPARLEAFRSAHGHLQGVTSLDELLDLSLDAVAIATPVSSHFAIARRCLEAGKHVWVEKPLASTIGEAKALNELADRFARVLMVDHTYLFDFIVGSRLFRNHLEFCRELATRVPIYRLRLSPSFRIGRELADLVRAHLEMPT